MHYTKSHTKYFGFKLGFNYTNKQDVLQLSNSSRVVPV